MSLSTTILWAIGATFAANFIIGLVFQWLEAQPLHFLVAAVALIISFLGGLYLRNLKKIGLASLPRSLLAGLSLGLATLVAIGASGQLGGILFGTQTRSVMLMQGYMSLVGVLIAFGIPFAVGVYTSLANVPFLFLGLPLTLYAIWIIGPMITTGYIAFTNWDGVQALNEAPFIGWRNFERLFADRNFNIAFWNNVRWLAFFILIPTSMGLGLAMIFNGKFLGARFFKVAFYSPLVIAPVVVGLVFEAMYRPQDGLINSLLRILLGPEAPLPGWLADPNLVIWCIIIAAAWRQVGYVMILYLAGLKSLDTSLVEAAIVDGANPWQRFWHVIFPLLGPVTVVVAVISVIDSLRAFDLVAIMTRGGPANASEVLANFMYMQAFNNYRYGYSAAIALVLLGLMLFFIVPYLLHVRRTELEY
ncbi:MAG: sugar ABC transporter permease [Anaerolineae bacterium]|nr:sugar ABC transporter permease [Anaerolineae bacterium]